MPDAGAELDTDAAGAAMLGALVCAVFGSALCAVLFVRFDVNCVSKLPFLLGALGSGMVRRSP